LGFVRQVIRGTDYNHVVYRNTAERKDGVLHVYLEGDGTPWLTPDWIAADPTPREPLALELMAQDGAPSLYLGRPCYHGLAEIPPCNPLLWTSRRYGPEVIDSMTAALQKFLSQSLYDGIAFIGYSGGGTLAMLLAERFPQTRAVLTVAGNLDPERWAAWHDYSPLTGSLNPATRLPLRSDIVQLHFAGGRDENMPVELTSFTISQQPFAKLIVINTSDHECCWQSEWPLILKKLQTAMQQSLKVFRSFGSIP
jgi:pimeloyl-ACP methyl ester carboxylesterase